MKHLPIHKVKRTFETKVKRVITFVSVGLTTVLTTVTAKADDGQDAIDKVINGSDTTFSDLTTNVANTGKSAYILLLTLGAAGLLCSIVAAGLCFASTKNSGKREENKSWIVAIIIGGIVVFGATFVIGTIKTIGVSLG